MTFLGKFSKTNSAETKKADVTTRATADTAAVYSPSGMIFKSF